MCFGCSLSSSQKNYFVKNWHAWKTVFLPLVSCLRALKYFTYGPPFLIIMTMFWWLLTSEKVCVLEWNLLPKSPVMPRDIKTQSSVIHSIQPFTYKQDCINCTSWDEGVFNVWSLVAYTGPTSSLVRVHSGLQKSKHVCATKSNSLYNCQAATTSNTLFSLNVLTWTWYMATDAQAK